MAKIRRFTKPSKPRRTALIAINNIDSQVLVETNGVSMLRIINAIDGLKSILAKQIVEEARRNVGDDNAKIEKWIDEQTKADQVDRNVEINLN